MYFCVWIQVSWSVVNMCIYCVLCLYMHHFESASSAYDHANVRAVCVHACPRV